MNAGFWTTRRTRRLDALLSAGLSMTQIAKRIGYGCTKGMVVGKVWRLGLLSIDPEAAADRRRRAHATRKRELRRQRERLAA